MQSSIDLASVLWFLFSNLDIFTFFCAIYWQDTKRNLRAVDKMLERYKDIGEQKAAVVHAVCMPTFLLSHNLYRLLVAIQFLWFYYKIS